jgi:hypothetical protein
MSYRLVVVFVITVPISLGSQFGFGCIGALEGRAKRYVTEFMKCRTKFRTENLFAVLSTLSSFAVEKADCNCLCVVVCLTGFKRAAKRQITKVVNEISVLLSFTHCAIWASAPGDE